MLRPRRAASGGRACRPSGSPKCGGGRGGRRRAARAPARAAQGAARSSAASSICRSQLAASRSRAPRCCVRSCSATQQTNGARAPQEFSQMPAATSPQRTDLLLDEPAQEAHYTSPGRREEFRAAFANAAEVARARARALRPLGRAEVGAAARPDRAHARLQHPRVAARRHRPAPRAHAAHRVLERARDAAGRARPLRAHASSTSRSTS